MKSQLIPIAGALIAGLIGAAGVACYTATTGVCATAYDTVVGYTNVVGCPYELAITPSVDWLGVTETQTPTNNVAVDVNNVITCHGPAAYFDNCNGQWYEISLYTNQESGAVTWYEVTGACL